MAINTKIYATQTWLNVELIYDVLPNTVASVRIKYKDPKGTTGFWNATHTESTKTVNYSTFLNSPLAISGRWTFWIYFTYVDGTVQPSSPYSENIYVEGN